jgi:hypothetical protein
MCQLGVLSGFMPAIAHGAIADLVVASEHIYFVAPRCIIFHCQTLVITYRRASTKEVISQTMDQFICCPFVV